MARNIDDESLLVLVLGWFTLFSRMTQMCMRTPQDVCPVNFSWCMVGMTKAKIKSTWVCMYWDKSWWYFQTFHFVCVFLNSGRKCGYSCLVCNVCNQCDWLIELQEIPISSKIYSLLDKVHFYKELMISLVNNVNIEYSLRDHMLMYLLHWFIFRTMKYFPFDGVGSFSVENITMVLLPTACNGCIWWSTRSKHGTTTKLQSIQLLWYIADIFSGFTEIKCLLYCINAKQGSVWHVQKSLV